MSYEAGILFVVFLTLAAVAVVSIVPAYYSWRWRQIWSRTGVRRPEWAEKLAKVARDFFATMAEAERLRAQADPFGLGIPTPLIEWIQDVGIIQGAETSDREGLSFAKRLDTQEDEDGWLDYDEDKRDELDFLADLIAYVAAIPSFLVTVLTCGGLKLWPARMEEPVWELATCGWLVGVIALGHWLTFGPNWVNVIATIIPACWLAYGLAYWPRRTRLPT